MSAVANETATCTKCGTAIVPGVAFQQCPRCLLDLGLSCGRDVESDWPAKELEEKEVAFDYELLGQIGRGGMGVVYRARQRSLNRIVALKMIAKGDFASPAALARFRREAETAARLDHPNIVAIIEVGERGVNPFLVMRLVEGDCLAGRLPHIALNPQSKGADAHRAQMQIARLLATVARAVDYAHTRGVLHRDLKPSNILLDLEGNPHLTDFGIAKSLDQDTDLTQTAELLGTLSYMAPEQAAGKRISRAADIYSLGAILYELLTGRRVFEGAKMDVLRQVIEEEPTQPRVSNVAIDRDLETICLKCLDKDPARRYATALQLAEDLDRWQRREPILARQAGVVTRLQRWTLRNPAVATLLVTLTIGMAATLALLQRANEEKARKSIALDILRTESARQLQEIWQSPKPFFEIKSETLSAMAGMEVADLTFSEQRFTIALVAEGNVLDRVLRAAPMFGQLEHSLGDPVENPARFDLRLYKQHPGAVEALVRREVDFAQLNAREFLRARSVDPEIQPLIEILPLRGFNDAAVIFTRKESGVTNLSGLRGKSVLLGTMDSTMTFWTKVNLVEAGIRGHDLVKYRYIDNPRDVLADHRSEQAASLGNAFSSMTPVEAVLAGVYDGAVVREKRFLEVAAERQLVALRRFEDTGDFLVARGNLAGETRRDFQRAMLQLKDGTSEQPLVDAPARLKIVQQSDFDLIASKLAAEAAFEE